jgi:hypothetical protein
MNPGRPSAQTDAKAPPAAGNRSQRTLLDKNGWLREINSKRVEVATSLLGFVITGILVGVVLPIWINNSSVDRDQTLRCWDSAIALRQTIDVLEKGFATLPASPVPRNSDLRGLEVRLQNTGFACQNLQYESVDAQRIKQLLADLEEVRTKNQAGAFLSYSDFIETGYSSEVDELALSILRQIGDPD